MTTENDSTPINPALAGLEVPEQAIDDSGTGGQISEKYEIEA